MTWTDFYLERVVDDRALRSAVAEVLSVERNDVQLVSDIDDASPECRVRVVRTAIRGEFPERIEVFLQPTDAPPRSETMNDLQRLSALLDARRIGDDEAINPDGWIVVRPDGNVTNADLDEDALNANAFVLRTRA